MAHIIHDERPGAGYPEDGFEWGEKDPAEGSPYETGPRKQNDSCPEHAAKSLATFVAFLGKLFWR